MTEPLLSIVKLCAGYGGRPVLDSFSLEILPGQQLAVIGPNGCGKSTLLRTVTAEIPESSGTIIFRGEDITYLETHEITRRGMGYLRQTRNVFSGLTVIENLELASMDGRPRSIADVLEAFPVLKGRETIRAGLMSGGERQTLAVAMVLMRHVSLLLLDEPLAGLSQKSAEALLSGIARLQYSEGFAVVMVEHRLKLIRPYVDRVVVMVRGSIEEDTEDTDLLENRERLEKHYLV
ncbi:MAG: ATP-binding cassette domain-containing protein [Methylococcales bacterium]|nr:ATP-binding cassette domain-containing protein [Methylococcales bacterium]